MSDLPLPDPTDPAILVPPGEIVLAQPLDIQHDPDPAEDHGPARRIPHLGHAALFFAITLFCVFAAVALVVGGLAARTHHSVETAAKLYPVTANLTSMGIGYVAAIALSILLFPLLWKRPFFAGVQWNALALRRHWPRLLVAGLLLQAVAQSALHFVHKPSDSKLETMMQSTGGAWITALFGTLLAPFLEELAFRGFLLPALATAYDWLALERTPAGVQHWQSSTLHTRSALVFAAIFSSIPFALLHAAQLSWAWGVVCILFGVSLALSYVRIRLHSLACSTLLHATYNGILFLLAGIASGGFRHLDKLHH